MNKLGLALCAMLLLGLTIPMASANTIGLFDYGFNVDGTVSTSPAGVNLGLFNTGTGLGTITATINGTGAHSFIAFFDHEIDETINTFYNEFGSANGAPIAGRSWEIDEPGFVFGDIYSNFTAGTLDNSVGTTDPEDVSMAMGWNFNLAAGQTASIQFSLTTLEPTSSLFYLQQLDPESQASVYLSSDLTIRGGGDNQVPEPSTLVLVFSGIGLVVAKKFRKSA